MGDPDEATLRTLSTSSEAPMAVSTRSELQGGVSWTSGAGIAWPGDELESTLGEASVGEAMAEKGPSCGADAFKLCRGERAGEGAELLFGSGPEFEEARVPLLPCCGGGGTEPS